MKALSYLLILLAFLPTACLLSPGSNEQSHFCGLNPELCFHSVKNYQEASGTQVQGCSIPNPIDSVVIYTLDLDADGRNDFELGISHSEEHTSYCKPCRIFTYAIRIEAIRPECAVATERSDYPIARILSQHEVLDITEEWTQHAYVKLTEGCGLHFQHDFEEGYLGVQIAEYLGYIHIEPLANNGIGIISYELNRTEGTPIVCGHAEVKRFAEKQQGGFNSLFSRISLNVRSNTFGT